MRKLLIASFFTILSSLFINNAFAIDWVYLTSNSYNSSLYYDSDRIRYFPGGNMAVAIKSVLPDGTSYENIIMFDIKNNAAYFISENGKLINPPKRVPLSGGGPLDLLKQKLQK